MIVITHFVKLSSGTAVNHWKCDGQSRITTELSVLYIDVYMQSHRSAVCAVCGLCLDNCAANTIGRSMPLGLNTTEGGN